MCLKTNRVALCLCGSVSLKSMFDIVINDFKHKYEIVYPNFPKDINIKLTSGEMYDLIQEHNDRIRNANVAGFIAHNGYMGIHTSNEFKLANTEYINGNLQDIMLFVFYNDTQYNTISYKFGGVH